MTGAASDSFSEIARGAIKNYFQAWEKHDEKLIEELFVDPPRYYIDGEERFNTLGSLLMYWEDNKHRQRNVKYTYKEVFHSPESQLVDLVFSVSFYEVRSRKYTKISGLMRLQLNGKKIERLEEYYLKDESDKFLSLILNDVPLMAVRGGRRLLHAARTLFSRVLSLVWPMVIPILFLFYISLIVLTVYLNFVEGPIVDWLRDPDEKAFSRLVNGGFAVGLLLQFVAEAFRRRRQAIRSRKIIVDGDDLIFMYDEMRVCSEVSIVSGDFSFISKNAQLERRLYDLASREKLILYSYKNKEVVVQQSKNSTRHKEIIDLLIRQDKIAFDIEPRIKCSLVQRDGASCFLYRYSPEDDGDAVAVIRSSGETSYLFQMVQKFIGSLG